MPEIQCLVRADERPTLLGESIYDSGLTQRGVKVSWSNSSTESTLVPWLTEQLDRLDNSLLPLFLMWEKVPVKVLDDFRFDKSSSGRQVTRCRDIVVHCDP